MSTHASGNLWKNLSAFGFGGAAGLVIMVYFLAVARVIPFPAGAGLGLLALLFLGFGAFARRKSRQ